MPDTSTTPAADANRLRSTALGERPQERLQRHGAGALSDTELLAMILRSGTRGQDVLTLASRLVSEAGSLHGLTRWREADFRRHKGIGRVKALQLITTMEIARRVLGEGSGESPLLDSAGLVATFIRPRATGLDVEKFWVLCLNRRNRLQRCVEVTSGTASSTLVHPREVYREAIREGASAIVCVHNHPSGDPSPSSADHRATRQIEEAGRAVHIPLLDHVIVGHPHQDPLGLGYYSYRDSGIL